jgi:hypothetical protein
VRDIISDSSCATATPPQRRRRRAGGGTSSEYSARLAAKSWPSQWCLEANSLSVQAHGGYGYTREYAVEEHYRDNRLNPIDEGTPGIQSLDLLGRKVRQRHGAGLRSFCTELANTVSEAIARGDDLAQVVAQLDSAWQRLARSPRYCCDRTNLTSRWLTARHI